MMPVAGSRRESLLPCRSSTHSTEMSRKCVSPFASTYRLCMRIAWPPDPAASKSVETRRVVDQDLPADRRLRRPARQLVQQPPVIDRLERADIGGGPAGPA